MTGEHLTGEPPPPASSLAELRDVELFNFVAGALRSAKTVGEVHRSNMNYALAALEELRARAERAQMAIFS